MLSIVHQSEDLETMDNPTPTSPIWNWLIPILISLVVTGGTILMTAGGSMARLDQAEKKLDGKADRSEIVPRLERMEQKIDNQVTKDDLKDLKDDVKDRIRDRK